MFTPMVSQTTVVPTVPKLNALQHRKTRKLLQFDKLLSDIHSYVFSDLYSTKNGIVSVWALACLWLTRFLIALVLVLVVGDGGRLGELQVILALFTHPVGVGASRVPLNTDPAVLT